MWDVLEKSKKNIPEFKVLLELIGILPKLYIEKAVVDAVGKFGVYLGTVAQQNPASIVNWMVVVASEKLEDIPQEVTMVARGIEHEVEIKVINWCETQLYKEEDFPQPARKFNKPAKPKEKGKVVQTFDGDEDEMKEGDEMICMSCKVLLEFPEIEMWRHCLKNSGSF